MALQEKWARLSSLKLKNHLIVRTMQNAHKSSSSGYSQSFLTCLLITATIKPSVTPGVARPDYSEREEDYAKALAFYLKTDLPIIFVENSNTKSARLLELAAGKENFEYHCFQSAESWRGKGHGEKEIIDFAYANSTLLKKTDWVVKVSGRYIVKNLPKLVREIEGNKADVLVNWGRNLTWSDTRIMFFRKRFYIDYFSPCAEEHLNEANKVFFERVFARSVHRCLADGGVCNLWPLYPWYIGINGENGRQIEFGLIKRFKFSIYYAVKRWIFRQIV